MRELGETDIQYAQCLWGPEACVLNSKRDRGDKTTISLLANDNEKKLYLIIKDLDEETMKSSSNAGAKKRIDLHIADEHLSSFIAILESFVKVLKVKFDEANRQAPDPTGMEHPNGLSLGTISPMNWVRGECRAYFKKSNIIVETSASRKKIYLDVEKYIIGRRIHFGISNIIQANNATTSYKNNVIELKIPYSQTKIFLHFLKFAKK